MWCVLIVSCAHDGILWPSGDLDQGKQIAAKAIILKWWGRQRSRSNLTSLDSMNSGSARKVSHGWDAVQGMIKSSSAATPSRVTNFESKATEVAGPTSSLGSGVAPDLAAVDNKRRLGPRTVSFQPPEITSSPSDGPDSATGPMSSISAADLALLKDQVRKLLSWPISMC